jgi:hypothetical protein
MLNMADEETMDGAGVDLERALAVDRARREAAAREALDAALQEIQARHRVDLVVVFRVVPSGATIPGIEFKAR